MKNSFVKYSVFMIGLFTMASVARAEDGAAHLKNGSEAGYARRGICTQVADLVGRLARAKYAKGERPSPAEILGLLNRETDAAHRVVKGAAEKGAEMARAQMMTNTIPVDRFAEEAKALGGDAAELGKAIAARKSSSLGDRGQTMAALNDITSAHKEITGGSIPTGEHAKVLAGMVRSDSPEVLHGKAAILREAAEKFKKQTGTKSFADIYEETLMAHKEIDEALEAQAISADKTLAEVGKKVELEAAKAKLRREMVDCGCGPNSVACKIK